MGVENPGISVANCLYIFFKDGGGFVGESTENDSPSQGGTNLVNS